MGKCFVLGPGTKVDVEITERPVVGTEVGNYREGSLVIFAERVSIGSRQHSRLEWRLSRPCYSGCYTDDTAGNDEEDEGTVE